MNTLRKVAIIGGARIPFARSNTAYAETGNQEMLTAAFSALVERFRLKGKQVGEVAAGARIVAMLAKQLAERGSGRGLISICTAGGMGVTAILER